jgi:phage shock protein A
MPLVKKALYWFIGDRAAPLVIGTWNWLWGLPIQSGGKVAVEVAEESLRSMQESMVKLTQSVSQVKAAYDRAHEKYIAKQREFKLAESQALLAHQNGNEEAARLAMSKAILIEQLLPQLAEQVAQARQWQTSLKEKLRREQEKLETYKVQTQNLKALSEVNEALAAITKVNTDLRMDSARSQFETAESAVQQRYRQVTALTELSENPAEKLTADLDRLTLDDEIIRRFQRLDVASKN